MSRILASTLVVLVACASEQAAVAPPPASARSVPPAPAATAPTPTATLPPPIPTDYATAYRALLEQMVAVDTSHGDETKLLEPIAALYREAGVSVQILESSPGRGNLLARLKGSGTKKPLLLLAHVDVIPVEGQSWSVPPFAVTEKDGFLYGRGIDDDKSMAAAIVASTLELARTRAPLTRDIIVALTAGEETGGSAGTRWLVENHKDLLDADIALNEGGAPLLSDDFARPVEVAVQVSEKTYQSYQIVAKGKGGHSSMPPTSGDPTVALGRALVKIGEVRFPARVLPETKASFVDAAADADPAYAAALRRASASAPRISPADEAVLAKDEKYNAQLRTTCVTTMLKASAQENVLPTSAEATVNCRILPGDTRAQVHAALEKAVGDPSVRVVEGADFGDGPHSPFDGEVVDAVKKVSSTMFAGMRVEPQMATGGSDSRFLARIGIRPYGVSPAVVTRAEQKAGHTGHGADERAPAKWLQPGASYFREVVRTLVL